MKGRAAVCVAWSLAALTVPLIVLHLICWTLAQPVPGVLDTRAEMVSTIPFAVVGALIVTRRPDNTIGWLFCVLGFLGQATLALDAYALYALAARPDAGLPAATAAAWAASLSWPVTIVVLLVLPLLFPTGRLPSPRWRPVAWLTGVILLVTIFARSFRPGFLIVSEVPVVANPLGIAGTSGLLDAMDYITTALFYPLLLVAGLSVVVRFRRAQGVERQQVKWFVYATVCVVVGFGLFSVLVVFVDASNDLLVDLTVNVPLIGWPVALGIAILRYRLYDIDRLINRTLVYGLLTVLLASIYASIVLILGQLFGGLGAEPPSGAVAGATLSVSALFQPTRRRIQAIVDRRFYRRKYDAAKTVETFSARLRDEVDLDVLAAELLAAADKQCSQRKRSYGSDQGRSPGRLVKD